MGDSFLSTLIDSTGNSYLFGKTESARQSVFLLKPDSTHKVETVRYYQIFKGHELRRVNADPQLRKNVQPDWFFPLLLLVLAVFAWIRIFYNKYFSQMLKALLNFNLTNQIVRDENILVQRATVYLSVVFNLIAALFLYLVSIHYGWAMGSMGNGFTRFFFFLIIVSAAYALKFLILKICGWLFDQEREMASYIFNIFLINNILGMTLLPLICILAYNDSFSGSQFIIVPLVLIAIAFAWRIFRGIQIGLGTGSFSPLYLFLYLCTLEIAPLMVLIRIVVT